MRRALANLILVAALIAARADAQPAVDLRFERGPGTERACQDEASFRKKLESQGCSLTWAADGVGVHVSFSRDARGFRARFGIRESVAEKSFATCAELAESVVLSLGIALCAEPVEPAPEALPAPFLGYVVPAAVVRGESRTLEIGGNHFQEGATVEIAGDGIVVGKTTWHSPTTLSVDVTIDRERAELGLRELTVTNPRGDTRSATERLLRVADVSPRIDLVSPAAARQAERVEVTITGADFRDDVTLEIGSGVAVAGSSSVFVEATLLRATFEIAPDAAPGPRDVTVRSASGSSSVTKAGAFTIEPRTRREALRRIRVALYAGSEGGYSFWSGGRMGPDQHYQSSAISGDFVAGGEQPFGRYTLDVLVTGYGATKRDRRSYSKYERWGRDGKPDQEYVTETVGATALRAAVRSDSPDSGVSLGLLVGGFQETGCRHDRSGVRDWQTPLCGEFQQWAAFPTFGVRLGPEAGPHATLGFLDGRTVAGDLAHLGVGKILPRSIYLELSAVASTEGVGQRLSAVIPIGDRWVIMPSAAGGMLYDAFFESGVGRNSSWLRAGVLIGIRQDPTE